MKKQILDAVLTGVILGALVFVLEKWWFA